MRQNAFQSADDRIVWDWEEAGMTWDEVVEAGMDYVDWSFGIPDGEAAYPVPKE